MLLIPNEAPEPSCGMPSINIFTCFPLNPSTDIAISEPTPPLSLSFIPGALERASLNAPDEFSIERVLMSTELYAVFRALLLLRPVTTISLRPMISSICMSSMVVGRCSLMLFSTVCMPGA
ncbi:hypothetical protein IMSAGC008_01336 [Muribaculaceae bacterium]|nr:hypothetical protein IMSAGC008_01336 [Muribaculaceae bacterium]